MFKIGDVVIVNNPQFIYSESLIINKSETEIWLLTIPRIDYPEDQNQKIVSQYDLSSKSPVEYMPPPNFFDQNRVDKYQMQNMQLGSLSLDCVIWDGKQFYKQYQLIKHKPSES